MKKPGMISSFAIDGWVNGIERRTIDNDFIEIGDDGRRPGWDASVRWIKVHYKHGLNIDWVKEFGYSSRFEWDDEPDENGMCSATINIYATYDFDAVLEWILFVQDNMTMNGEVDLKALAEVKGWDDVNWSGEEE